MKTEGIEFDDSVLQNSTEDGIGFQQIMEHITDVESSGNDKFFIVKTANEWLEQASKRKIPNELFGEFWYENEVCILFADTNVGKSILAVQIAESISSGDPVKGFRLGTDPLRVLYLDFELSDKQFEARYSEDYQNHYNFSNKFLRAEINLDAFEDTKEMENALLTRIESLVRDGGYNVVIVDNMTYLKGETERAKDALPLMKELKSIKEKNDISLLVLAHTPKRDFTKPISRNDLSGSKMLINFCDSAFAIGESVQDPSLRYIKQIKVRNKEKNHSSDNVVTCSIEKKVNFLGFSFIGFDEEDNHLHKGDPTDKELKIQEAITLRNDGMKFEEISAKIGRSVGWLSKNLPPQFRERKR